jgi:hypothetical protein
VPQWWLDYGPEHGDSLAFDGLVLAVLAAALCKVLAYLLRETQARELAASAPRLVASLPALAEFFATSAVGLVPAAAGAPATTAIVCAGLVPLLLVYRNTQVPHDETLNHRMGAQAGTANGVSSVSSSRYQALRHGLIGAIACLFLGVGAGAWLLMIDTGFDQRPTLFGAIGSLACLATGSALIVDDFRRADRTEAEAGAGVG